VEKGAIGMHLRSLFDNLRLCQKGERCEGISIVTPAQAEVQRSQEILDSRLRGNDIPNGWPRCSSQQIDSELRLSDSLKDIGCC